MIIDLPDTTTSAVSKRLVSLREEGGVVALGRVLTLIIVADRGEEEDAIEAANDASREHPMRVIVISRSNDPEPGEETRIDAQIRIGADAGASEVIILRAFGDASQNKVSLVTALLLPDAPVVAWWPGEAPLTPSETPIGRLAQRRITDASAHHDTKTALAQLADGYAPGDTDFAWTRLTLWRAQLAAVLDQPPYEPVTAVSVSGASDSPSTKLLAAWLELQLQVDVTYELTEGVRGVGGIHGVALTRESGVISLERPVSNVATLSVPGQPAQDLSLPRRNLRDCLAEELRRLDPDVVYGDVITKGLELISTSGSEGSKA